MRTTCFGYDKLINELEKYQPYSYDPYQDNRMADMKPFLDIPMDFNVLAQQEWSRAYKEDITVRKVFDLQEWDITYELGTFWHQSAGLQKYCTDNLNETWFYDSMQFSTPRRDHHGDESLFNILWINGADIESTMGYQYILYLVIFLVLTLIMVIMRYKDTLFGQYEFLKGNNIDDHLDIYGTF